MDIHTNSIAQAVHYLKRASIALFLLLFSCASHSPCWNFRAIDSACPEYFSKRIYMNSRSELGNVQLEFVRNTYGIKSYLNLFYGKIPDYRQDPCKALVSINVGDGECVNFISDKFEGNQKLLLPEPCSLLIINSLLSGLPVSIDPKMGQATFQPANFKNQWQLLLK